MGIIFNIEGRKKILVIDDDKEIHTLLKMGFEKAGYQVFAALDSMQGLMMAKTGQARSDSAGHNDAGRRRFCGL